MATDWTQEGVRLLEAGQYQQALACLEQALSQRPDDADTWLYRTAALIKLTRYAEANASYQQAQALNPLLWTEDGIRLLQAGSYQQALDCFDQALSRCPEDADTWAYKATALGFLGRRSEMLVCSNRALELQPQNTLALKKKAAALFGLGRRGEAVACLEQAHRLGDAEATQAMADLGWFRERRR
jgi:tetratricopeptide (TPR) repeat protein